MSKSDDRSKKPTNKDRKYWQGRRIKHLDSVPQLAPGMPMLKIRAIAERALTVESVIDVHDTKDMAEFLRKCKYVRDKEQFDQKDYWQTPDEFEKNMKGDCEDFALWSWRKFVDLGEDARFAYGAADFILMPSRFEPCGLPQMIAPLYGTLPVAHDTGGIHDTITHMNVSKNTGNGFLFETFDANGLFWAIEQAMDFYSLPQKTKTKQIERIMTESMVTFTYENTARQYIKLYEKMLKRPLIAENITDSCSGN